MDATFCAQAERAKDAPGDRWSLGGILRRFLPALASILRLGKHRRRVLERLAACGTAQMGLNVYTCPHCQHAHCAPRSCGDRHCPACLAGKSHLWLEHQMESLLPVAYYHCVFTLPAQLHGLVLRNQEALYKLLFESASATLLEFGRSRLGGDVGISAVLHTWGQQLDFHPHLHCIVSGGALSADGKHWRSPKQRKFLFPVRALGALFRGKFLHGVRQLLENDQLQPGTTIPPPGPRRTDWLADLYKKSWVVYAKRPFGGPQQVLSYLANYTHRVALSNRRIVQVDEAAETVTFRYRDYRHGSQQKQLTLGVGEFVRRFALHILPYKFVRIRHYGILANNRRKRDTKAARSILSRRKIHSPMPIEKRPPPPQMNCPNCGKSGLRLVAFSDARGNLHVVDRKVAPLDSS